jgi:hypothetical protein
MLWDEDCRTAGLGKTERPVGWEGNGEPATMALLRNFSYPAAVVGVRVTTRPRSLAFF